MLTARDKKFAFTPFKAMVAIRFPMFEEGDKFYGNISLDPVMKMIKQLDKEAYFFGGDTYHGYFVNDKKASAIELCIFRYLEAQGALELLP